VGRGASSGGVGRGGEGSSVGRGGEGSSVPSISLPPWSPWQGHKGSGAHRARGVVDGGCIYIYIERERA